MAQIIVIGNAVDGLAFIGPFDNHDKALEYADIHLSGVTWNIADLNSPEKDEEDHDFEDDDYWDRHSEAVATDKE